MCTASWIRGPWGFELFFNRDEQRARPLALPPREVLIDGVRVLMPLDGQDRGTWISANEHGLVLGLLNLYEVDYRPLVPRSRGLLVVDLASASDADDALQRLSGLELDPLRPFTLTAMDPRNEPVLARWDGSKLAIDRGVAPPLISSGFDLENVRTARLATWERVTGGAPTVESLERFHASRFPAPGAYAVSMAREDACTVSCVRVRVDAREVALSYQPGAPADRAPSTTLSLPRARKAGP